MPSSVRISSLSYWRHLHRIATIRPVSQLQSKRRSEFWDRSKSNFRWPMLRRSTLYNEVLQPAIAMADNFAKSKSPPADLDKFYSAVAEFIGHYQQAKWPFADKQHEIESLLTTAIAVNPKVAKYYTSRGVARISSRRRMWKRTGRCDRSRKARRKFAGRLRATRSRADLPFTATAHARSAPCRSGPGSRKLQHVGR